MLLVNEKTLDIIALTKIMPQKKTSVLVSEFCIQGYNLFVNESAKRGVAIFTKCNLNATECDYFKNCEYQESVWCDFKDGNNDIILFGCIYRSPNSSYENTQKMYMVNEENFISNIEHYSPIGKSDHETLLFTLYTGLDKSNEQEVDSRFDINKGNYNAMRDSIAELDWTTTLNGSIDQCWESIKGVILNKMEEYIPTVRIKNKSKISPKWMNGWLRRKIKKKYSLYKRYLSTKNNNDYKIYKKECNECHKYIRMAKRNHEKILALNCKTNPKVFWRYVQAKVRKVSGISPLQMEN